MITTVVLNEWAWEEEGPYEAWAYDEETHRLIQLRPKSLGTPGSHPGYQSHKEAMHWVRHYYPNAQMVSSMDEIKAAIKAQGYRKPTELETNYLCHLCDGEIRMDRRSLGAGNHVPYGGCFHRWYHCVECKAIYAEFIDGWIIAQSHRWSYHEEGQTGQFTKCQWPKSIEACNPYGFQEIVLRPLKNKE